MNNLLRLKGSVTNNYTTIQAHESTIAHTLTLPFSNPSTASYLTNTSAGTAYWTPISNSYASKRVRIVYVPNVALGSKHVSFINGSAGATYTVARQSSMGRFTSDSLSPVSNSFYINTTGIFKFTVSLGVKFAATSANQFRSSYLRLRVANGGGGFVSGSVTDDGNLGTTYGTIQTTKNCNSFVPANSTYPAIEILEASCIFNVATTGVMARFHSEIGLNGGLQTSLGDAGVGALTCPTLQTEHISYMQLEQLA